VYDPRPRCYPVYALVSPLQHLMVFHSFVAITFLRELLGNEQIRTGFCGPQVNAFKVLYRATHSSNHADLALIILPQMGQNAQGEEEITGKYQVAICRCANCCWIDSFISSQCHLVQKKICAPNQGNTTKIRAQFEVIS